ncbi:ABC transporter ATP-binding protein [Glaciimonas immobilis]|uniref:Spermidine/putrescine transport system ATP-binding protein n=1 Tax=Glaciimonas immobilis TaxID=728004 RepID=A0A840RWZ1_9BURK|nr:ABC transporter ATP-binding protein [Glaciimonas immobilis]MBB5201386.1 spermidine/putrescine transport system ATP-binding protein [Glaciimonas immobilis]
MALLEIRNVSRCFGDFTAVNNISLSIEAGEFFTLLGPSGCGKTTLLRMIAGFDLPNAGQIILDGVDLVGIPPEQRPVCTVFQNYALFPHMTVAGNIAFPLKMAKMSPPEIKQKVVEALEDVRLIGFGARFPHELSGGQRQRVAVARALVSRPKLLLLDEPLSAMDAKLREQMQIELINLQKEVGITFVYVTHDQTEALALSHRIAVLNHGQVEQLDEPSRIYSYPRTRFVADFIGTCNLFDGTIGAIGAIGALDASNELSEVIVANGASDTAERENTSGLAVHVVTTMPPKTPPQMSLMVAGLGRVTAALPPDAEIGRKGTLALRPEKIRISAVICENSADNHFKGYVKELLYLGDVTVYIVQTEGGATIEALLANSAAGRAKFFEVGDTVEVAWSFDAGHFLYA